MPLATGTRLGPYEVLGPLGAGGMGEVYRAKDTRLDRAVAIKVLPSHLSSNPDLRARFEREARAVSSLNHPHICTLHDVGHQDGTDYIVMELVEGETLLDRLKKGPLPLEQTLRYGIEVADALDKAHRHGVIHRDLKPGNVMLTKAGSKLMDFGLAKRALSEDGGGGVSALETREKPLTEAGSLLGTYQYMSPEQLEGKEADARADIWALGCVLYEMATGKRAFEGKSQASLISAIMTRDPQPIAQLQPMTPPALHRLVKVCLAKNPDERWQSAHDVMAELRWIGEGPSQPQALRDARRPWLRSLVTHALAIALASGATGVVVWRGMQGAGGRESPSTIRTTIRLPEGQRMSHMMYPALALSRDGKRLAYVAQGNIGRRLYLRALGSNESTPLPGTDDAWMPFFSPDGQWLGFVAGGKIKRIAVSGGTALTVANAPDAVGASWGEDGRIVFAPTSTGGLWRVSPEGGAPEQLTKPDFAETGNGHAWPQYLPGSKKVLFEAWGKADSVAVLDLETRQWRIVLPRASAALYSRTGHLLFMSRDGGRGLFAVPFDVGSASVFGPPVSVADEVAPAYGTASLQAAVSDSGTLVYLHWPEEPQSLLWVDREGRIDPAWKSPNGVIAPRLSSDGRQVAFIDESPSVWSLDLHRRVERLLAKYEVATAGYSNPVWKDDGASVALCSNLTNNWDLYDVPAEGGELRALLVRPYDQCPESWARSPDGPLLAYTEWHPTSGANIWILPAHGEPRPVAATLAKEAGAALAPDGRYVAYVSDESGRDQIYVRVLKTTQTIPVTSDGGTEPLWSRDGRELFFRSGDRLMVVGVAPGPELRLLPPKLLFELPFEHYFYEPLANYDVSPDGRRFLIPSDTSTTEIQLVVNWAAGLTDRPDDAREPPP